LSGGSASSSEYWPGFVDALTNVVIAMVFVIVVLAISLSFAMQMIVQKASQRVANLEQQRAAAVNALALAQSAAQQTPAERDPPATSRRSSGTDIQVVGGATGAAPGPIDLSAVHDDIKLNYAAGAATLDAAADAKLQVAVGGLQRSLAQAGANAKVQIVAQGPHMDYSDNQRAAYIRVITVRNVLLAKGIRPDQIEMQVDRKTLAPQDSVTVRITGH
jgi:hypothetical protein